MFNNFLCFQNFFFRFLIFFFFVLFKQNSSGCQIFFCFHNFLIFFNFFFLFLFLFLFRFSFSFLNKIVWDVKHFHFFDFFWNVLAPLIAEVVVVVTGSEGGQMRVVSRGWVRDRSFAPKMKKRIVKASFKDMVISPASEASRGVY